MSLENTPDGHLDADDLKAKCDAINPSNAAWSDHPEHSRKDWRYEVVEGNTQQGYWQWVEDQIEESDGE